MDKRTDSLQKWYQKNSLIALSLFFFFPVGFILMLKNVKGQDQARFKRLACAGLCVISCSFLACAPASLGVERKAPESLPTAVSASPLSSSGQESSLRASEPDLKKLLAISQSVLKEVEPDRRKLELELYKAAGKANIASIDKIEVTGSAKETFAVSTELTILQNDVKEAKWAAVTLYKVFAAVEGYQVSSYTFAVTANQSPLWTISKTVDDEKFSITSIADGTATTFTAQELEQERAAAASSGSSAADPVVQQPPAQTQPVPAAPTPVVTSPSAPSADDSWTDALDKNAPDTNEITGPLDQTAYWTPRGKSYHFSSNCVTLKRSKTILNGTLQQALSAGKADPCNLCAGGR